MQIEDFFAYESFRPNQKELALRTYESCLEKRLFLTEAMSGFGKTAAVLSGVIFAAREKGCKVIYTCRTKRQILRVVDEISLLQRKQTLRAASMFSKFDYCLLKRSRPVPQESFGWYCGFNVSNNMCSYFLNVALQGDSLARTVEKMCYHIPKHSDLLRESESIHVCPYELTRLAVAEAEVIVVPYHYLFDFRAKPVLLDRNAIDNSRVMLVVDEAHNIRDFLRSTMSAAITLNELSNAASEAESLLMSETSTSLKRLNEDVQAVMSEASGWYIDRESFIARLNHQHGEVWLQNLIFELTACSEVAWHSVTYGRRLPFLILKVGDFLNKLLLSFSSEDTVLTKWNQTLGLVNTNPTEKLSSFLKEFHSTVLISATINPSALFQRSIGIDRLDPDTYTVQAAPLVNVLTVVDTGVTTKYKSRTPEMYDKIAAKIIAITRSVNNGTGIFAPSYSVLEAIRERVSKALPGKRVLSEARGLSNQEANDLMESFRSVTGSVLFAVQGGRFSEGEDFAGDVMDATVIVGLSLPPPTPQLYAEYAFLKRNAEPDSYLMISLLPALRKAFQAAGRHLRNPGKRGLVFMLDRRFDSTTVKNLMPSWLKNDINRGDFSPEQIELLVHDFFLRT